MNEVISGTEKIQEGGTQLSGSLQQLETGAKVKQMEQRN